MPEHFTEIFNKMQILIHRNAKSKGWWDDDDPKQDGVKIALMHCELSEAVEALREGGPESIKIPGHSHVAEELGDTVIRIMDYCEARGIDLAAAIEAKHAYNTGRDYKHGGKVF